MELNGERGSLCFDLERLNELAFHDHTEEAVTAGFRRILVTQPGHPYLGDFQPPPPPGARVQAADGPERRRFRTSEPRTACKVTGIEASAPC
jgi:hypothetical protein